jgi:hypothetical protein
MTRDELREKIAQMLADHIQCEPELTCGEVADQILALIKEDERVKQGCEYGHAKCDVIKMLGGQP